ncbi:cytochrome C biogenesis protein [Limnohabitans sp. TS-CS-82]|uniref:carbohydrate ABC transporter permease n=1 Tax=Limnohabitans sp. TS-CS-82 TaxID=2094193 RepID=UPI000CF1F29A|nr:sugar ABC transporter permease [Limnohabitans sp. TS-CS-82]PQA83066.1 cytochrome C biogenesis protein [Limnohabitans sp. TS-CS-82]
MKPIVKPTVAPYVLISPFIILFLVFGLFPILFSFVLMFHSWDPVKGLASMEFVGLENVSFALEDPLVWTSLGNTLWLAVVSGLPQHLVAIPLAYLINEKLGRWRNAVMGAYFLPYITSTVAIAMMFSTLFSTDYGMVNAMLTSLAKSQVFEHLLPSANVDWLGDPQTIKPIVAFVVFWRYLGFNVILYVAAMQAISRDQYEAARMDGAKSLQQFWYITLPQLKPIMFFGVTLTIIGGLQLFEEPFILTGGKGGMEYSGMTTAMYMFRTAFDYNDYGLASAISWMLFIIILAMTVLTNRAFKSKEGQS